MTLTVELDPDRIKMNGHEPAYQICRSKVNHLVRNSLSGHTDTHRQTHHIHRGPIAVPLPVGNSVLGIQSSHRVFFQFQFPKPPSLLT